MGAIIAGAGEDEIKSITGYGRCIGLAFQISDDIIDVESSSAVTGKDSGADAAIGKVTYPGFFGVAESRERCLALIKQAKKHLSEFPKGSEVLKEIADLIGSRSA